MRRVFDKTPLWVIGYDEDGSSHRARSGFISIDNSGNVVKNTSLSESASWDDIEIAKIYLLSLNDPTLKLMEVSEYENGSDRLCIKLTTIDIK